MEVTWIRDTSLGNQKLADFSSRNRGCTSVANNSGID
jgi:hypothetical protein